jgi:ABC-type bacteriocin/lantibiotic exporter with double-glycine peptidase domain
VLHPDASWCGPRVLYFFSVYLGRERALDEVVALCHTDQEGLTSMADLARAAEDLGLNPTPVRCTADDLLAFNGPALVSLSNRTEGPVHFVGLLGEEAGDFVVLDPSVGVRTQRVRKERIARSFTGHAILLGESGASRARSLGTPAMYALSACWAVVLLAYLRPGVMSRLAARFRGLRREAGHAE